MATNAPQMHDGEAIALTVADWLRRRRARAAGQSGGLAAARIVSDMMRNRRARRVIVRAAQKWRGSTMYGYVYKNGDHVYSKNFRMSQATFNLILNKLQAAGYLRDGRSKSPTKCVPGRLKLAVAL